MNFTRMRCLSVFYFFHSILIFSALLCAFRYCEPSRALCPEQPGRDSELERDKYSACARNARCGIHNVGIVKLVLK